MRIALALTACILLAGCATPMEPVPGPPVAQDGNDCAVIAAVAREHFRFGPDNPPLPIRFEAGYAPRCDWSRHGIAFTPWDSAATGPAATRWVSFARPRYDGQGAVIEVGIMHGPLAGQGSESRVRSGFAGWTVTECRATWVS